MFCSVPTVFGVFFFGSAFRLERHVQSRRIHRGHFLWKIELLLYSWSPEIGAKKSFLVFVSPYYTPLSRLRIAILRIFIQGSATRNVTSPKDDPMLYEQVRLDLTSMRFLRDLCSRAALQNFFLHLRSSRGTLRRISPWKIGRNSASWSLSEIWGSRSK